MAAEPTPGSPLLPAELPLLVFRAAGVAMGVEAASVEGILDAEEARSSGIAFEPLAGLLGAGSGTPASKVLLFKGRGETYAVGIDELEELVILPTSALQPMPEPLSYYRGPRTFWGAAVRENKVVLLVDVDRLPEPMAALGEARP